MKHFVVYIITTVVVIIWGTILYAFLYALVPVMVKEREKTEQYQVNCTHQWQVAGTDTHSLYKVCTKCNKYIRIK